MPAIQVSVINPSETEKITMQVPNDAPIRDLREAMIEQIGLPTQGNSGQKLRYHLNIRNEDGTLERLNDQETLGEKDVKVGGLLQITLEMAAGGDGSLSLLTVTSDTFDNRNKPSLRADDLLQRLDNRMKVLDDLTVTLQRFVDLGTIFLNGRDGNNIIKLDEDQDRTPPSINYLDFDITFTPHPIKPSWYKINSFCLLNDNERLDGDYECELPVGQTELSVDYLHSMGIRVRQKDASISMAEKLGAKLFNFAFGGTIRDCFSQCRDRWEADNQGIRVRLDLTNVPELITYPWEFMWNADDGFLAWNSYYPIIRYLPGNRPTRPLSLSIKGNEPLRMLVFVANPQRGFPLDIERERDHLQNALKETVDKGLLTIRWLDHASIERLEYEIINSRPHIIHYIGHGGVDEDQGGYISLEGTSAPHEHLFGDQLAVMLRDCRSTQLVVLNTCRGAQIANGDPFSSIAMQLAKAQVPATIAMQYEISDSSAVLFSQFFYKYLAMGWSIYEALGRTRKTLFLKQAKIESLIPSLYSRSPNGIIFKREKLEEDINT